MKSIKEGYGENQESGGKVNPKKDQWLLFLALPKHSPIPKSQQNGGDTELLSAEGSIPLYKLPASGITLNTSHSNFLAIGRKLKSPSRVRLELHLCYTGCGWVDPLLISQQGHYRGPEGRGESCSFLVSSIPRALTTQILYYAFQIGQQRLQRENWLIVLRCSRRKQLAILNKELWKGERLRAGLRYGAKLT